MNDPEKAGWTLPAQLRLQVMKRWNRGDLLASLVTGESLFPLRLTLKIPTSAQIAGNFEGVCEWITRLTRHERIRIESRASTHRIFGRNQIPRAAWIDSLDDATRLIGKHAEATRFRQLIETTEVRLPQLRSWLAKRPLQALELAPDWERLLDVVVWLRTHPRPNIYLRQMDLPNVHTKFVEAHRKVLAELLDLALPPEAIDSTASGAVHFNRRYGFRDKPERIRLRFLDPVQALLPGGRGLDVTLDSESFARLEPNVSRVFITENEINFLAFPEARNSLVLFGAGYGFDTLCQAAWLQDCRIYYWGDIDTHGFAILDQLRVRLFHTESLLMDKETLLAFRNLWGEEASPTRRELPRLTPVEAALYDDLRQDRLAPNLRLEQERIRFNWLEGELEKRMKDEG
ncbi:MAG: Wadjet anti-phage system protein JetD domain-containing protein [Opitutales bacterium]